MCSHGFRDQSYYLVDLDRIMNPNFNGLLEVDYCPFCKSRNQINYDDHFSYDSQILHYYMFGSCHICKRIFVYEYAEDLAQGIMARVAGGRVKVNFVYRYPTNEATTYESVEPEIKKSYLEGVRCLNANAPNGAVTMFRRTLQQICKHKGATKKDLKDQIDEIIPSELKTEAHELRSWGNLGAHPDEIIPSVEIEDAKQLQEFIDRLLYALYEYPSKIKKTQDKRMK